MADLTSFVEFIVSTAVVALPISFIVLMLADDEPLTVGELVVLSVMPVVVRPPAEESTPPRWRPELISRVDGRDPHADAGREDSDVLGAGGGTGRPADRRASAG